MSRTLSGLFLVGALNRPRKRKGTNRENPWTIPEQIGKIPKDEKDKKGMTSPDRETPPFEPPPVWRPLTKQILGGLALLPPGAEIGRTPKGSYSPRGQSRHVLETPVSDPF